MTIFAPVNDGLNGWSQTGLSAMIDGYRQFPTEGRRMTTMISEVYSAFKTAGVPEQEAQQAAEALSAENLATKDAVAENKHDLSAEIAASRQALTGQITEVRQELTTQIGEVRQEFTTQIAEVRQELATQIGEVRQEIAEVKQELSDKITEVKQELTSEIAELKRMMSVMQWMLGLVLLAVVLPILRDAVS